MKGLFINRIAVIAAIAAAAVVGWFVDKGILTGEQSADATGQLTTALNGLGAAAFAVVALIGGWVLRRLAGGNSGGGNNKTGGSGGGIPSIMITAAAFCLAGLALSSCSVIGSAITGAPIPATAVQRAGHADATPFMVASGDLAQAEAAAEAAEKAGEQQPVNGLYDAGRAASTVREVFTDSSK
jgi:hypothetical protein